MDITHLIFLLTLIMASTISVGSYNMHGKAKDRFTYIEKVLKTHDFLLVQEHWLLSDHIKNFHNELSNVCVHGVSSMNNTELLQALKM